MTGGYSRYQQQQDIEYMTAAAGLIIIVFFIFSSHHVPGGGYSSDSDLGQLSAGEETDDASESESYNHQVSLSLRLVSFDLNTCTSLVSIGPY